LENQTGSNTDYLFMLIGHLFTQVDQLNKVNTALQRELEKSKKNVENTKID